MIVSHRHKFIFIKTRKTAGTSLEIALSKFCGPNDIVTPIDEIDEAKRWRFAGIGAQNCDVNISRYSLRDWSRVVLFRRKQTFHNHMKASQIKRYIGQDVWEGYYKFCFERNPWDKVVSLYYWLGGPKKFGTFQAFLASNQLRLARNFPLYSDGRRVIVDKVFRYEDLDRAVADLAVKLQITKIELPRNHAKGNTRPSKGYLQYFDDSSREVVKNLFHEEIELFDYKFAGS